MKKVKQVIEEDKDEFLNLTKEELISKFELTKADQRIVKEIKKNTTVTWNNIQVRLKD